MSHKITYVHSGTVIAATVMVSWFVCLILLLTSDLSTLHPLLIAGGVFLQTFLYTGLFITAHDAMHGTIAPKHKKLNHFLGTVCVILYALFSFEKLRTEHRKHHAHPADADDPDFHDGEHDGFWSWYLHFMKNYVTWKQILGMAVALNVMLHIFDISLANLLVFWIAPSLASTLQLFYFGTYLPHRQPEKGYSDHHRSSSNDYSTLISFVTCYHFGYHWEHHEFPGVPWWQLPEVRHSRLEQSGTA
jgi:beta-carotene ketolase (CrtW type)